MIHRVQGTCTEERSDDTRTKRDNLRKLPMIAHAIIALSLSIGQ